MEVILYIGDRIEHEIVNRAMSELLAYRTAEVSRPVPYAAGAVEELPEKPARKPRRKAAEVVKESVEIIQKEMDAPGPDLKHVQPAVPAEPITKEQLQERFKQLATTDIEKAKGLLNQFGAARFNELPAEKYGEFAAALPQ